MPCMVGCMPWYSGLYAVHGGLKTVPPISCMPDIPYCLYAVVGFAGIGHGFDINGLSVGCMPCPSALIHQ